jgi:adenosylmethionine-8-amino-7-oxononanoate aminotransferase
MIPLNFPTNKNVLYVTSAEKYWVHTKEYGRLLETLCGNTAFIFGFNNKHIIDRITQQQNQLSYLVHTNYTCDDNDKLIELLCKHGNFYGVSYAVSGTDGVECAIAMNDYYWNLKGENKPKVVSFSPGYHGITFLARALRGTGKIEDKVIVTDAPKWSIIKYRESYETYCFNKLRNLLESDKQIGAVIMESIPWFNELKPWSDKWWKDIRNLCTEHNVNLIIDDVMGGMGKLGDVFSHTKYGIQPDIAVLGKALTGGYSPLSVACTSKEIADTIKDTWEYGHTWQPNMMGVAAALTSLELLDNNIVTVLEYKLDEMYKNLLGNQYITSYVVKGLLSEFSVSSAISSDDLHKSGLTCNQLGNQLTSIMLCTPVIADDEYFIELEKRIINAVKHK